MAKQSATHLSVLQITSTSELSDSLSFLTCFEVIETPKGLKKKKSSAAALEPAMAMPRQNDERRNEWHDSYI